MKYFISFFVILSIISCFLSFAQAEGRLRIQSTSIVGTDLSTSRDHDFLKVNVTILNEIVAVDDHNYEFILDIEPDLSRSSSTFVGGKTTAYAYLPGGRTKTFSNYGMVNHDTSIGGESDVYSYKIKLRTVAGTVLEERVVSISDRDLHRRLTIPPVRPTIPLATPPIP